MPPTWWLNSKQRSTQRCPRGLSGQATWRALCPKCRSKAAEANAHTAKARIVPEVPLSNSGGQGSVVPQQLSQCLLKQCSIWAHAPGCTPQRLQSCHCRQYCRGVLPSIVASNGFTPDTLARAMPWPRPRLTQSWPHARSIPAVCETMLRSGL